MDASATPPRIAVIGAGVTGASAVSRLARLLPEAQIFCFDQGRDVGGRACSRFVKAADGQRARPSETEPTYRYDHGCQFFRADSREFRNGPLAEWLERGWAAPWQGRFGVLPDPEGGASEAFFGVPAADSEVYCGLGGMHRVPAGILEAAAAEHGGRVAVRPGQRVSGVEPAPGGKGWTLKGTTGAAALHTTREEEARKVEAEALSDVVYDAVLVTDVSAAFAQWHRASAGLPDCAVEMLDKVRSRVRVPLFTCFVTFEAPLPVALDGIVFRDDKLWFAARSASKPGFDAGSPWESWTLVATPAYAVSEIQRVPMQDPKTGIFLPQERDYLLGEGGPCKTMLAALEARVGATLPKVLHVDGQRWGSAFPAPTNVGGRDECGFSEATTVTVMGVRYDRDAALCPLRLLPGAEEKGFGSDFLANDELGLFYAGDYISPRPPGVEAAALSGRHAAEHVAALLGGGR